MIVLWLVVFTVGLLLGVRVMISGAERPTGAADGLVKPGTLMPMIAAFGTIAGFSGYILTRFGYSSDAWALFFAMVLGGIGAATARMVVRRSFSKAQQAATAEIPFRFQGHVARVVAPIEGDRPGRIVLQVNAGQLQFSATTLDGTPIGVGSEVVIERIDGDAAVVEPWSRVEDRL